MKAAASGGRSVNNEVYERLGERWYTADDDPVALLRAEARLRNPWVGAHVARRIGPRARVLDVGCGAGFLANALAREGHEVTAVDASVESLRVAASHDATRGVRYERADALDLPYPAARFDVVCAMDLLEHVEDPPRLVAEASRVLRPGGLFFFHTFDRNFAAWLVIIKGVEWFVANTPRDLHVLRLFIRPAELRTMCSACGLEVAEVLGSRPVVWSRAFLRMIATGRVSADFRFRFTRSTRLGYTGLAERREAPAVRW